MSVPAAYLGIVLIWGTTPLAIKWSGEGVGYLFGVTGRMVIGVVLALALVHLMQLRLPWHRVARYTYLAAGLGIYVAMTSVYWASQFLPSGWIAVLFGLAPIVTGLMARIWLAEQGLTPVRLAAMLVALSGLAVIFDVGLDNGHQIILGMLGVLFSVISHSASAVWVKRMESGLHGLVITTGGLVVSAPLFLLTWFLQGEAWPVVIESKASLSILYLGVVGSVLGFALYYYVLRHIEATRVALITLVTPVIALLVGHWLNGEAINGQIWLGTLLIMTGLLGFEMGSQWMSRLRPDGLNKAP
ncbi:MAG: DMT family transporter [Pseudomonadota bacterium]